MLDHLANIYGPNS